MLLRKAVIHHAVSARLIFVQLRPFPAEIWERLLDPCREDILRLQDLIGSDLSPWLEGAGVNAGVGP
jgi:hypothetical protein